MKRTRVIDDPTTTQSQPIKAEKVIVLLGEDTLLGSAIEILLAPRKDWQVVKMQTDIVPSMIHNIEMLAPSAVIVFQHERIGGTKMLMQLLEDCPGLKVITVSMDENSIQVYHNQMIWVKEAADLLSAVEI
jgi:hypothetical protein